MKLERTKRLKKTYQKLPKHIQEQVNEKLKQFATESETPFT